MYWSALPNLSQSAGYPYLEEGEIYFGYSSSGFRPWWSGSQADTAQWKGLAHVMGLEVGGEGWTEDKNTLFQVTPAVTTCAGLHFLGVQSATGLMHR